MSSVVVLQVLTRLHCTYIDRHKHTSLRRKIIEKAGRLITFQYNEEDKKQEKSAIELHISGEGRSKSRREKVNCILHSCINR